MEAISAKEAPIARVQAKVRRLLTRKIRSVQLPLSLKRCRMEI